MLEEKLSKSAICMSNLGPVLENLFQPLSDFVVANPVLWFVILAILLTFNLIKGLATFLPKLEILRSKILIPAARKFKHHGLVKAAVRSDIVGHVNNELVRLRRELPAGWVPDMNIEWVERQSREDLLDENLPVLRIRPLESQDRNFANAAYYFLRKNFFPKTKNVIPTSHRDACVLYIARKVVARRGTQAKAAFEDGILEPAVEKNKNLPDLFEDYKHMDDRGFFTGTFLRELHEVGKEVRFSPKRKDVRSEPPAIIRHLREFIEGFESEKGQMPEKYWSQIGPVSSYALLLVAHPEKVKSDRGIVPYVNRAKEKVSLGVKRLYVFGRASEEDFVNAVIDGIWSSVPEFKLHERFTLHRDYRKDVGGIGALFIRSDLLDPEVDE